MIAFLAHAMMFVAAPVAEFQHRPDISGPNAIRLDYGRYTLFRTSGATYALRMDLDPAFADGWDGITFTWYRRAAGGTDFLAAGVEVTRGTAGEVRGSGWITAPGFAMEWSKANAFAGWVYWREAPADVEVYPWMFDRLEDARIVGGGGWVRRGEVKDLHRR